MKIILASASPRRFDLLHGLGHQVEIMVSYAEELGEESGLAPGELAITNAQKKAHTIFSQVGINFNADVIIAADSVIVCGGAIFGKATDADDARAMLAELARTPHEVVTGYAIISRMGDELSHAVTSQVEFRSLSAAEIEAYVKSDEWRDKAGSYAIQGIGAALIRNVRGSISNIIGIPVDEVLSDAQKLVRAQDRAL